MSVKMLFHRYMGAAANNGYAIFLEPGTSTPKATYESDYSTAASLNAAGGVEITSDGWLTTYLLGDYDFTVFTRTGVEIPSASAEGINPQDATAAEDETRTINLLVNGSFEIDSNTDSIPDNWTLTNYSGGANVLDSADKGHGSVSMKFTSVGSGGGILISDDFIPISPQKAVQVSFLIKSTADVRNLVEAIWYTAGGTEISDTDIYDNSTTNPTAWAKRGSIVIPPATAYYMKVRIYGCHSSDTTSGTSRFDDVEVTQVDTNFIVANAVSIPALKGYIYGFVPTTGADADHDLDFSGGICRNSTDTAWCRPTWTSLIKQLDAAWAEGTNQGGMATGSVAADTVYYYNLIRKNADETVFDIVIDVSAVQANTPSGWTFMREVYRLRANSAANTLTAAYRQLTGGAIEVCPGSDYAIAVNGTQNPGTSRVTFTAGGTVATMTPPPSCRVTFAVKMSDGSTSGATFGLLRETAQADSTPSLTNNNFQVPAIVAADSASSVVPDVFIDSSRQATYRISQSTTDHFIWIVINNWVITRN